MRMNIENPGPQDGGRAFKLRGTTLLKSLAIGLPVAFGAVLLASTAQAAACAGSGVITRIQGLNTDVAITRAGKPVSRIRVLEVVCVGDVVTAKGGTVVTLSIDGVGAVKVDRAKSYTVGPRRGKPSATGNVYRAVSDQVLPDMKRLPWDVRTKGPGDPLRFTVGTQPQFIAAGRTSLLVRLVGHGPYEVSLLDASGATVKSVNGTTEELTLTGLNLSAGDYRLVAKDTSGATAQMELRVDPSLTPPTGEYEDISDPEVVAAVKAMQLAQSDPAKYSLEAQQILATAPSNGLDRDTIYKVIETLSQVEE